MTGRTKAIAVCVTLASVLALLASYIFARHTSTIREFSPDTLELRVSRATNDRFVLPINEYRLSSTFVRLPLVDKLVNKGYWKARNSKNVKWLRVSATGYYARFHSLLYLEMAYLGDGWIQWTEENPEYARVFWPLVLRAMRQETDSIGTAALIMRTAKSCKTLADFVEAARKEDMWPALDDPMPIEK